MPHSRPLPPRLRRLAEILQNQSGPDAARPVAHDLSSAMRVLKQAGLDDDYSELFQEAEQFGVRRDWVALILLNSLLRGPLRDCVTEGINDYLGYWHDKIYVFWVVIERMGSCFETFDFVDRATHEDFYREALELSGAHSFLESTIRPQKRFVDFVRKLKNTAQQAERTPRD
jgi:hypothetical protein